MFKNKNCVFIRLQPGNQRTLSVFKQGFLLGKPILSRHGLHTVKHTGLNVRLTESCKREHLCNQHLNQGTGFQNLRKFPLAPSRPSPPPLKATLVLSFTTKEDGWPVLEPHINRTMP